MKKALVAILAVAALGLISVYTKHTKDSSVSTQASSGSASQILGQSTSSGSAPKNYKDGTYQGAAAETPYGTVQIAVVITAGKLSDIHFLKMPNDFGHSQEITRAAEPLLKQITLNKQSAGIDFVSGATSTSYGYQQSLQAALDAAVKA